MAIVVIAGTALVPLILLPAMPFIWLAAVSLGVWKGYLVVQLGTGLGMSLSYVLGKHILRRRIKRYPDELISPVLMQSPIATSLAMDVLPLRRINLVLRIFNESAALLTHTGVLAGGWGKKIGHKHFSLLSRRLVLSRQASVEILCTCRWH